MNKKLFLFVAIAAVIGVGILVLPAKSPPPADNQAGPPQSGEASLGGQPEQPTEQTIQSLIPQILGSNFDAGTATWQVANLDNQEGLELIIGAAEGTSDALGRPVTATIQIVTLLDEQGAYDRIGAVEYSDWLWGAPDVLQIADIDGDGQQEIFIDLMYGGAASFAQGVLDIDIQAKQVRWARLQDKSGAARDAIFINAVSAVHWNKVTFADTDNDKLGEIVEVFGARDTTNPENIECSLDIYEWNGNVFAYTETLSEQTLGQLSDECEL